MGLSYDEVQFPASISQGAVGGMRFSTTIIGLSWLEHRNISWASREMGCQTRPENADPIEQ
jgi:hypothetical protein